MQIHELELLDRSDETLRLKVSCSKGTYIRSLARDIGASLGCGAHLSGLRRTASAPFDIRDAVELESLEAMTRDEARALLSPPDCALEHLPAVALDEHQAGRVAQGQRLAGLREPHSGQVRIYGPAAFLGVGEMDGQGHLKPLRLFVSH